LEVLADHGEGLEGKLVIMTTEQISRAPQSQDLCLQSAA